MTAGLGSTADQTYLHRQSVRAQDGRDGMEQSWREWQYTEVVPTNPQARAL